MRTILTLFLVLTFATPALAGQVNLKKIKKWPAIEQTYAKAFDAWMTDEELDVLLKMKVSEERIAFLTKLGYLKRWNDVDEEIQPVIARGEVINGMTQDQVYMAWDKPAKIRKDFRKDAYVDVLNYEFERDRKGREFVLREDSQTSYKNEVFTRFVYLYNGRVFRVVEEGFEEDVLDELPVTEPEAEPTPPTDEPAEGDEAPAEGDEPTAEGDEAPAEGDEPTAEGKPAE